jgi:hypothetical protein
VTFAYQSCGTVPTVTPPTKHKSTTEPVWNGGEVTNVPTDDPLPDNPPAPESPSEPDSSSDEPESEPVFSGG